MHTIEVSNTQRLLRTVTVLVDSRQISSEIVSLASKETAEITASGLWGCVFRNGQLLYTGPGGNEVMRGLGPEGCLVVRAIPGGLTFWQAQTQVVLLDGPSQIDFHPNDDDLSDNGGVLTVTIKVFAP